MQRLMIPIRGGHLAGLNFGRSQGPIDLVFLHATGFNALTYRQLLQPLGDHHRVVALDLRGHGLSTLPARALFLTDWYRYAADVIAAVRHLSRGQAMPRLIAGHSMGATTALLALRAAPDLAGALLMIDPAVVPQVWRRALLLPLAPLMLRRRLPIARAAARRRSSFASRQEALSSYRGRGAFKTWQAGFLEDYLEDGLVAQADGTVRLRCEPAWESATFAGHRHDSIAALRSLRVPARLMAAEKGSTTLGLLPALQAAAPAMAIETVEGCSHFVPMEKPQRVRERMIELMHLTRPA